MSALSGLADANGRINAVSAIGTVGFRAMAFLGPGATNGKLARQADAVQARYFNGSVMTDATGNLLTDTLGAITHYAGGLPLVASGALAVELGGTVTRYDQGVGFTAAGRVAIT